MLASAPPVRAGVDGRVGEAPAGEQGIAIDLRYGIHAGVVRFAHRAPQGFRLDVPKALKAVEMVLNRCPPCPSARALQQAQRQRVQRRARGTGKEGVQLLAPPCGDLAKAVRTTSALLLVPDELQQREQRVEGCRRHLARAKGAEDVVAVQLLWARAQREVEPLRRGAHADERIGAAEAGADVEARLERLDQAQLEDAGIDMRRRDLPGAGRRGTQDGLHPPVAFATRRKRDAAIRGESAFQTLGLSDVDDFPVRIEEPVDPRLVGSRRQELQTGSYGERLGRHAPRECRSRFRCRYTPPRRRRTAKPPRASRRAAAASTPLRDNAGAAAAGFCEHIPAWPGLSQDCAGGHTGSAQQVLSTQFPDMQSAGSSHAPPFGTPPVGVTVGVLVAVAVAVGGGVIVAVRVTVPVAVIVGVELGVLGGVPVPVAVAVPVLVAVAVGVSAGVMVAVSVSVAVAVIVGVELGVSDGVAVSVAVVVAVGILLQKPLDALSTHRLSPAVHVSATPPEQSASVVNRTTLPMLHRVVQTCVHSARSVMAALPQQPEIEQLPHGLHSGQLHTQHAPCATGTQAKAASIVTAATCRMTQSDHWPQKAPRRDAFQPVLKVIRSPRLSLR